MPQKYSETFRARAVRMVLDRLEHDDAPSRYVVIKETAPRLNIAVETLRRWVEQAEINAGKCPGVSSDAQAEIRRLKRENSPTEAGQRDSEVGLSLIRTPSPPDPRRDDRVH